MSPASPVDPKVPVFFGFFAFWIILGLSAFAFFHLNRDAKLKKKVHPFFVVSVGVIFASFAGWMSDWEPFVFLVMLPMIALITFLNLRSTRFCEGCGRTLYRQPIFGTAKFCPHCGRRLDGGKTDI